jgi:hypothetical protein
MATALLPHIKTNRKLAKLVVKILKKTDPRDFENPWGLFGERSPFKASKLATVFLQ